MRRGEPRMNAEHPSDERSATKRSATPSQVCRAPRVERVRGGPGSTAERRDPIQTADARAHSQRRYMMRKTIVALAATALLSTAFVPAGAAQMRGGGGGGGGAAMAAGHGGS